MGSKTNRNLQAKNDKAKRQRIEAGCAEYSKPGYYADKAADRATLAAAYAARDARIVRRERLRAHF